MPSITSRYYQVLDKKLHVAQVGHGPSLVFIHGWSNSWVGWTLLAHQLSSHYTVYMPDMLGFGDSDSHRHYNLNTQTKYLSTFIRQFCPQPVAIAGASLGTVVTAHLIHTHPHITSRTILIGAMFSKLSVGRAKDLYGKILRLSHKYRSTQTLLGKTIKARYTAYFVEKFLNHAYHFDRSLVDKYNLPGRSKMSERCYVEMGISAYRFNLESFLKTTKHPTLIIYGANERYVTPDFAHQIMKKLHNPHLKLHIIPQSGHNPAYEQPARTRRIILDFLASS